MCMRTPKTPKPTGSPQAPPPQNPEERPQTPVVEEGFGEGDQITAKRKGRTALTIPLGGLNIPGR
jgi:hypothetical protein